jgi:threonine/homoserine/homoserine lactone efflux protein
VEWQRRTDVCGRGEDAPNADLRHHCKRNPIHPPRSHPATCAADRARAFAGANLAWLPARRAMLHRNIDQPVYYRNKDMDWYILAQFLSATLLVFATPGPVMAIVSHGTLRYGTVAGFQTLLGVGLGEVCLLGATFAGLTLSGELLPTVFRWLSLAGALYLIWLAVEAVLVRGRTSSNSGSTRCRKPILEGLTIAFANPAALLFCTAFFPQFINTDHSISEQMVVLSAIYVSTRLAFGSACVLAVARLPAGWTRFGRFAELGSAAVYLSIAAITVLTFVDASG